MSLRELEVWREDRDLPPFFAAKRLGVKPGDYVAWRRGHAVADLETQGRVREIVKGTAPPVALTPWDAEGLSLARQLLPWSRRYQVSALRLAAMVSVGRSRLANWMYGSNSVPARYRKTLRQVLASPPPGWVPAGPPPALPPALPESDALRAWRRGRGLTLRELGRLLDRSQSMVSRWETTHQVPGGPAGIRIMELVYGVTAEDLREFGRGLRAWLRRNSIRRERLCRRLSFGIARLRRLEKGWPYTAAERAALEATLTELSGQRPAALVGSMREGDPAEQAQQHPSSAGVLAATAHIVAAYLEASEAPVSAEEVPNLVRSVRRALTS